MSLLDGARLVVGGVQDPLTLEVSSLADYPPADVTALLDAQAWNADVLPGSDEWVALCQNPHAIFRGARYLVLPVS